MATAPESARTRGFALGDKNFRESLSAVHRVRTTAVRSLTYRDTVDLSGRQQQRPAGEIRHEQQLARGASASPAEATRDAESAVKVRSTNGYTTTIRGGAGGNGVSDNLKTLRLRNLCHERSKSAQQNFPLARRHLAREIHPSLQVYPDGFTPTIDTESPRSPWPAENDHPMG